MSDQNKPVDFLLSTEVSEISADPNTWQSDCQISEESIQEMTQGDDSPMFVEFTALYEGLSNNNREYTEQAVRSCPDAMLGVNMYLGHIDPKRKDFQYRDPVGKVVAARLEKIQIGNTQVLAAKGKAYITSEVPKLRSDIRKGLAGAVSILGNAKAARELGSSFKKILELKKPLKSVDFCNPGTAGMPHAGVTDIVQEMSGCFDEDEETMTATRLTKEQLAAEYATEIAEITGEQATDAAKRLADEQRKLAADQQKLADDKTAMETEVAEITRERDTLKTERDELKQKLDDAETAQKQAELDAYALEQVAEIAGKEGANKKAVELAGKDLKASLVDGDLEKSKKLFDTAFASKVEHTLEIAEQLGGGGSTREEDGGTKTHSQNKKVTSTKRTLNDFLSDDLKEGN